MDEIIILLVTLVVIVVPALAVTARIAVRPLVEAIIRLREGLAGPPPGVRSEELQAIRDELADLRRTVERLAEIRQFDRQLEHTRLGAGEERP
jgi:hypothetical protein